MAETTGIAWTDATFNPWVGCTKVAAGCTHCYAEADMDHRRHRVQWGPHGTRSRTSDSYWRQPLAWDRQAAQDGVGRRVFCASLADVFEEWPGPIVDAQGRPLLHDSATVVPWRRRRLAGYRADGSGRPVTMDDLRADLFALIDLTPHLTWQLLTKRPENIRRMWSGRPAAPGFVQGFTPGVMDMDYRPNVWLLTSVAVQADADRNLPHLLACRDLAPVLGVSAEPLLGPVNLDGLAWPSAVSVNWVIVGGESGGKARPMDLSWARSLVRQCKSANVACFVKQMGSAPEYETVLTGAGGDRPSGHRLGLELCHRKGGCPDEWPADLRVREFPHPSPR